MFYNTEYPRVYTLEASSLDIFKKPIIWFKPYLSGLGQLLVYRFKIKPNEKGIARDNFHKRILRMSDGSKLMLGMTIPSKSPRAVVIYLHTVCGDYTQMAHITKVFDKDNIAYVSYTRSGNDPGLDFTTFNFIGRIEELQLVIQYISNLYPGVPIHAIGASAGSALLIRYLGKYNTNKAIKSAVLVSPGYNFVQSLRQMSLISKSYLVNKMKYTIRHMNKQEELKSVRTLDDWVNFQSYILGYKSRNAYIQECDPINYLEHINVPSLFISSLDDTVFPGSITQTFTSLPQINPNITMVITKQGGHALFEDVGHDQPWYIRVIHEWINKKIK